MPTVLAAAPPVPTPQTLERRDQPAHERGGYIPGLDGLRAVAILAVLFAHQFEQFQGRAALSTAERALAAATGRLGTAGVRLFFAISGFLICSRLLVELAESLPAATLRSFYIRRAYRILPPLAPYLATLAAGAAVGALALRWGEIVAAALFAANYFPNKSWYTTHFWSLAVEEHFYLVWAPLLAWAGPRRAAWFAVAVIAATAIVRPLIVGGLGDPSRALEQTHLQLDAFMFSCLIALMLRNPARRAAVRPFATLPVVIAIIGVLGLASTSMARRPAPGLDARTVQACAFSVLVVLLTLNPGFVLTRALEVRWLTWLGRRSYGIYVWQQLIFVPSEVPLSTKILLFVPRFALVLVIAEISFRLLEVPLVNRGRQLARAVGPVAPVPNIPDHA